MSDDTIFALSTPAGRSAIAVVRASGPHVRHVLEAVCGGVPEPRRAALRRLRHPVDGSLIDEALILFFASPRSETGEDIVEFHVHGGRAVIEGLLAALAEIAGCRPAEPGEFARRGLHNGKLDLAQVEGLADLIDAETDQQRRQALDGLTGIQSAAYEAWRSAVLTALAQVEAAIDFVDEADVAADTVRRAEDGVARLSRTLEAELADGHRGEILRDGFRVVLAGPPNAGKSSLLNALARRDAAIVSNEAGTTRDIVDVRLDLGGWPVLVSDTAGLRETTSEVEKEGIRRTLAATRRADLVLWLVEPGGASEPDGEVAASGTKVVTVETKADLLTDRELIHVKHESRCPEGGEREDRPWRVSTRTGYGLDLLTQRLADAARHATSRGGNALITRARHRAEITTAHAHLQRFASGEAEPTELRAEHLRRAASAIGRLTGHIGTEDVLGEIFSRFCIGK